MHDDWEASVGDAGSTAVSRRTSLLLSDHGRVPYILEYKPGLDYKPGV